jgi:hypothetical protein
MIGGLGDVERQKIEFGTDYKSAPAVMKLMAIEFSPPFEGGVAAVQ